MGNIELIKSGNDLSFNRSTLKTIESNNIKECQFQVKETITKLDRYQSTLLEQIEKYKILEQKCTTLYIQATEEMDKLMGLVVQIGSDDNEIKDLLPKIKKLMTELSEESNMPDYVAGHQDFDKKIKACLSYRKTFLENMESDYVTQMADLESSGIKVPEETMYQRIAESYEARIIAIIGG